MQKWYADFIDKALKENYLKELSIAANFLGIPALLDLCLAKIASLIKDQTPEKIRENLRLSNNFSKADEDRVKDENKWANDL